MNFKLKSDTIFIIRFKLEEIYYLKKAQTAGEIISRPTLFVLTKKFTNKQLQLYKELPINENKLYKISLEIHEMILLKNILLTEMKEIDCPYSRLFLNKFIEELN
jgi:hypothetical protein